ncbi:hypothetical protein BH20VER3_BH20VER3_10340 [soil metagenome]
MTGKMAAGRLFSGWMRDAAGWLLVAAILYIPWNFGGTTASGIDVLNALLGGAFFCWLVSSFLRREKRNRGWWPWVMGAVILLLLSLGWGLALNAHAISDADYQIMVARAAPWPAAPGSFDLALSIAMMRRVSALLGALWVVTRLVQDGRWLIRLWWALALAGASIGFLGLLQKATGAQMILWEQLGPGEAPVTTFFATFFYHANAGAYLNLSLPAVLGLAFRYGTRPAHPAMRALWIPLSVIMVLALLSNTSRAAQVIAVAIILGLLLFWLPLLFRRRLIQLRIVLLTLLVGLLSFWAIALTSHLDVSFGRWDGFSTSWSRDARWGVDAVALDALPEAGAFGFGPGTFNAVFPALLEERNKRDPGQEWIFLHNDWLQTLLEWGWIGAALWAALFFGGITSALVAYLGQRGRENQLSRQRIFLIVALVALGGVALHAAIDFPLQIASIQLSAAIYLGMCWSRAGRTHLGRK